jgi:hypothetical protein
VETLQRRRRLAKVARRASQSQSARIDGNSLSRASVLSLVAVDHVHDDGENDDGDDED